MAAAQKIGPDGDGYLKTDLILPLPMYNPKDTR